MFLNHLNHLSRLRARDERAARELVETFGPQLRRIARFQLGRTGLQRCLESTDVCQSVLAAFFQRVAAEEFELDTPEQVLSLLKVMIRNCVYDKSDYFRAARRDVGRMHARTVESIGAISDDPRASVVVSAGEIRTRIRALLSDHENWLLEQREAGRTWPEISSECGASSDALRKQFGRMRQRLSAELGLGESQW